MRELRTITVREIKAGDEFTSEETGQHYWTAAEDARRLGHIVVVGVQHLDGGTSERAWDDPMTPITVVRDWPEEDVAI